MSVGVDRAVFSPRASATGHHIGDEAVIARWAQACNDLTARVVQLYPHFVGVCQLPQSPRTPPRHDRAGVWSWAGSNQVSPG